MTAEPGPALEPSGLQDRRGLDLALALGALALAGLCGLLISADLRPPVVSAQRQVGVLTFDSASVRRRLAGSLVWEELRSGEALYERDSIFVQPRGTATLALADGARLELDGSTLVVLERPLAVSFQESGGLGTRVPEASGGQAPMRSERRYYRRGEIPTVLLKVERSPGLVVQVAQDRQFSQVLRQATVDDGQYPAVMDRPGLYWWRVLDPDGKPRGTPRKLVLMEDAPPILISPRPGGSVPSGNVPFSWGPLHAVDSYRLQVSAEPEFAAPVLDMKVEGTRFRWATGDTKPGTYFWRVRALSQERAEAPFTEPRQFRLESSVRGAPGG